MNYIWIFILFNLLTPNWRDSLYCTVRLKYWWSLGLKFLFRGGRVCMYFCLSDFSQLRICRPSPQKWTYSHENCAQCWLKNKILFFPIFIFWVITDCIYNFTVTYQTFQVCHRPKKISFKSGQILKSSWKMWNVLNRVGKIMKKIQIGEFFYYFSHSIQHIPHLSWSF